MKININKKRVIPIMIIIVALALLAVWEVYGKEKVTYVQILTAAKTIEKGEVISVNMLDIKLYPRDTIVEGAIKPGEESIIIAKTAKHDILKNSQMSAGYVYNNDFYIREDQAIYKIEPGWISSISSSVRSGDTVGIYTKGGERKIGSYKVAFVKDQAQREITDGDKKKPETLERTSASSAISYIEVIASMAEYKALYEMTQQGETFLIVQEEAGTNG